jgi:hypothetical protein
MQNTKWQGELVVTMAHQYSSERQAPVEFGGSVEERKTIDWTVTVLGFAGGVTFAWVGLLSWGALHAISRLFG